MTFNLVVFFFRHHASLILLVLHQLSRVFSTSRAEKNDGLLNLKVTGNRVSLAGPYLNFPSFVTYEIYESYSKGPRVLRVFFVAMTSNTYARTIRIKAKRRRQRKSHPLPWIQDCSKDLDLCKVSFYFFPWQITIFHHLGEDFWFTFPFASDKKIQEESWKFLNLESPKYLSIGAYCFGVNYNEFRIMVLFVWGGGAPYIFIYYMYFVFNSHIYPCFQLCIAFDCRCFQGGLCVILVMGCLCFCGVFFLKTAGLSSATR